MGQRKFVIGDLVRCYYEFHTYYTTYASYPYQEEEPSYFVGLIVSTDDTLNESYWGGYPPFYGPYYEVYCTDGRYRYFIEEELEKFT
tara:strand:- start:326 stop:586 length:261 start_codon:yes stop_codon:yes gene_type:complete